MGLKLTPQRAQTLPRLLLVGDPHVEQTELDDCEGLIELVCQALAAEKPDYVIFLGDQHHNHALVHLEVMGFWKKSFECMAVASPKTEIITLVGNHDMPGNGGSKSHAMVAYEVTVPEKLLIRPGFACISYCHSEEEFRELVSQIPEEIQVLFCHQTFDGAKYENGFYAKDGFSLGGLERFRIISGHIHTPSSFANVAYIGAPRWRTVSDANTDRFLWLMEGDEVEKIPTAGWCKNIVHILDNEQNPLQPSPVGNSRIVVDLTGTPEWIKDRLPLWKGAVIRTFPVISNTYRVRESQGIHKALEEFIDQAELPRGVSRNEIKSVIQQRIRGL